MDNFCQSFFNCSSIIEPNDFCLIYSKEEYDINCVYPCKIDNCTKYVYENADCETYFCQATEMSTTHLPTSATTSPNIFSLVGDIIDPVCEKNYFCNSTVEFREDCIDYIKEESDINCHFPCEIFNCTAYPSTLDHCEVWTCWPNAPPTPAIPSSLGEIIGISIGCLFFVVFAIICLLKICQRRRRIQHNLLPNEDPDPNSHYFGLGDDERERTDSEHSCATEMSDLDLPTSSRSTRPRPPTENPIIKQKGKN